MSALKQVIILRKDLNMRKGKMVAQGAHASIKAILSACNITHHKRGMTLDSPIEEVNEWLSNLQTKICVGVDSEQALLDIYQKALDTDLPCSLIKDAGLTEFKEPTFTAVAIGPADATEVDKITGSLKLL